MIKHDMMYVKLLIKIKKKLKECPAGTCRLSNL